MVFDTIFRPLRGHVTKIFEVDHMLKETCPLLRTCHNDCCNPFLFIHIVKFYWLDLPPKFQHYDWCSLNINADSARLWKKATSAWNLRWLQCTSLEGYSAWRYMYRHGVHKVVKCLGCNSIDVSFHVKGSAHLLSSIQSTSGGIQSGGKVRVNSKTSPIGSCCEADSRSAVDSGLKCFVDPLVRPPFTALCHVYFPRIWSGVIWPWLSQQCTSGARCCLRYHELITSHSASLWPGCGVTLAAYHAFWVCYTTLMPLYTVLYICGWLICPVLQPVRDFSLVIRLIILY